MDQRSLPPLPTLPITSTETLRKCRELSVGPKDVFVCSFPKSGTTWMQNIVFQLLSCQRCPELPLEHISQYAPFYEIDAHWDEDEVTMIPPIRTAHAALGCRIFNTHLRWDMLPRGTAKYIYVVRDGRDVLTSFYHHMTHQHVDDGGFSGDLDEFFSRFLEGTVAYGKWSHHLMSWIPHCLDKTSSSRILLVRYEDLKQDLKQQVTRIADFLQLEGVLQNDSTLEGVLERVSFDYMRQHQELFHPISVRWKPGYNFIRSGTIGDHGSIFDEQHKREFEDAIEADFGGKEKLPEWLEEFCFHR